MFTAASKVSTITVARIVPNMQQTGQDQLNENFWTLLPYIKEKLS